MIVEPSLSNLLIIITLGLAVLCLVALSVIDLRKGILPNKIVFTLALSGIAYHSLNYYTLLPPELMLTGAFVGGGFLYAVRLLAIRLYGPNALGLGDVKLLAAGGIWLGPHYALNAIIIGALAGLAHGLILAGIYKVKKQDFKLATLSVRAGPGFAFGIICGFIMMIYKWDLF